MQIKHITTSFLLSLASQYSIRIQNDHERAELQLGLTRRILFSCGVSLHMLLTFPEFVRFKQFERKCDAKRRLVNMDLQARDGGRSCRAHTPSPIGASKIREPVWKAMRGYADSQLPESRERGTFVIATILNSPFH